MYTSYPNEGGQDNTSHREVACMAGNQTDARRQAEWNLKEAIRADASLKDINVLRAAYEAASYIEDKAMGKRP